MSSSERTGDGQVRADLTAVVRHAARVINRVDLVRRELAALRAEALDDKRPTRAEAFGEAEALVRDALRELKEDER